MMGVDGHHAVCNTGFFHDFRNLFRNIVEGRMQAFGLHFEFFSVKYHCFVSSFSFYANKLFASFINTEVSRSPPSGPTLVDAGSLL